MSLNNISSAELRRLISIVERKERVQEELREIESKLSTYVSEPTIPSTRTLRRVRKSRAVRASKQVKAPKAKLQQAESKTSARRGALKDALLAALQKADGAGIAIKDLSRVLDVKAQNLHVWFSSTGRKVKGVTKVSAGRWAYEGN
jgi:Skp family chaperone for outer membrane proteins